MAYDVTKPLRDVNALQPVAQTACKLFFQELYKAGVKDVFITETLRPQARQNYLWEQGRTRPGKEVTWTLTSNHTPGYAWDIGVAPPKDLYDRNTINRAGAVAKKLGITWGGSWNGPYDSPHFEVKSTWKIPSGYKLEGTLIIPIDSKTPIQYFNKEEEEVAQNLLLQVGRDEMKVAIEQAVAKGLVDKSHIAKMKNYTDVELLSYGLASMRRLTIK